MRYSILIALVMTGLACSLSAIPESANTAVQIAVLPTKLPDSTPETPQGVTSGPALSPFPTTTPVNPQHDCRVTAEHLHLRASASETSPVTGYLAAGDTLTLGTAAPVGNWIAVIAATKNGWVNSRYTNCQKLGNQ